MWSVPRHISLRVWSSFVPLSLTFLFLEGLGSCQELIIKVLCQRNTVFSVEFHTGYCKFVLVIFLAKICAGGIFFIEIIHHPTHSVHALSPVDLGWFGELVALLFKHTYNYLFCKFWIQDLTLLYKFTRWHILKATSTTSRYSPTDGNCFALNLLRIDFQNYSGTQNQPFPKDPGMS